jgi:NAD(P)-dependent dehydrogenase (short-subunit alcohol dehydrogenase family)
MDYGLKGRRVLVTGATGGLGGGMVRAFVEEGARIVIHSRGREKADALAAELAGAEIAVAIGELGSDEGAAQIASQALAAFGGIDILVNNAGGEGDLHKDWLELDPAEWARMYSTDVLGAVRLVGAIAPGMIERKWGRILQISAGSAVRPLPMGAQYSAAKAALSNATVSLAATVGIHGVTSNAILCGPIHTSSIEKIWTELAPKFGWGDSWDEIEANAVKQFVPNPLQRLGRVEEVAAAVLFLCSEGASYINGASLRVDGGALGVV